MAVVHKNREMVDLLVKNGYDVNAAASCRCKGGSCSPTTGLSMSSTIMPRYIAQNYILVLGYHVIAMTMYLFRTHSITPEWCNFCAGLRSTPIIDQTPLSVAVRAASPEIIAILVNAGADVNLMDEDGNGPMMLAVRESPISWECIETLMLYGAKWAMMRYFKKLFYFYRQTILEYSITCCGCVVC